MQGYIGTKVLNAAEMTLGAYNDLRGWDMPENENPEKEGYLVEYLDGGEPNHEAFNNYISWSPKEQFENAYRETNGMSFGLAVEAMKKGMKTTRMGWNGKGMFCIYVPGTSDCKLKEGTPYANALPGEKTIDILPHFDMYTVNAEGRRAMLPGWLASQSDMDADDWIIVE